MAGDHEARGARGMRRAGIAVVASAFLLLSGVAVASVLASSINRPSSSGGPSGRAHESDAEAGIHGGPIDRFHGSGCSLTNVSGLQGNWTHGDYVSTVAVTGDAAMIVEAAHSDCGKPMVSVIHESHHGLLKAEKHESRPAPGS